MSEDPAGTHLAQAVGTLYGALIERIAIRCAKGNNGGEWATHYTKDQKNVWRKTAAEIIAEVAKFLEE